MKVLERWEADEVAAEHHRGVPTLAEAIEQYINDCRRRKLASGTVRNYGRTLGYLRAWTNPPDVSEIKQATIREFLDMRSGLAGRRAEHTSSQTLRKEMEHLRAFFAFCVSSEWMASNPAKAVKMPKDRKRPTLPFTPNEVAELLSAINLIDNQNSTGIERARLRAKGLLLLLLYSGLRVGDAVALKRNRLGTDGRLMLRMEKTQEVLYVKLPQHVVTALQKIPVESEYFFWSGNCALDTAVGSARRTIACLARITGINAHPHRFRDTFSVELLKSGADLFTVQKLLGHTSIKTTEKHYAPWVKEFQERLDRATGRLRMGGH